MKRIIIALAALLIVPALSFAQVAVGGAAFVKSPVYLGNDSVNEKLDVNQLCFGGDVRLKNDWFQAEALVMCATGEVVGLDVFTDLGIAVDVAAVRFSLGAGPNVNWNFGVTPLFQTGMNAKIGADVMFSDISVGVSYIMSLKYNERVEIYNKSGLFGVQVLFWL